MFMIQNFALFVSFVVNTPLHSLRNNHGVPTLHRWDALVIAQDV